MNNFTYLGRINVDNYADVLRCADWNNEVTHVRKKMFAPHSNVDVLSLMWSIEELRLPVDVPAKQTVIYDSLYDKKFFGELESILTDTIGAGYFTHIMFLRLPGRKHIDVHVDSGEKFSVNHRIHIPVITNPKVLFTVGGETIHMRAGEIIEIENTRPHGVNNFSDEARIHLLVDWYRLPEQGEAL